MADDRIKDLSGEVAVNQISALLNTLYLAVDDTSFTDAKKILLKTILTEAVVDANTNNYQAMTPKAFYDSVMTDARKGIARLATDGEVTAKTEAGVLKSIHQVLMQAQWFKDWFIGNANIAQYKRSNAVWAASKALAYDVAWQGALTVGEYIDIHPSDMAGTGLFAFYANCMVSFGTVPGSVSSGTLSQWASESGVRQVQIGTTGLYLRLGAKGLYLRLVAATAGYTDIAFSAHINAVLSDFAGY